MKFKTVLVLPVAAILIVALGFAKSNLTTGEASLKAEKAPPLVREPSQPVAAMANGSTASASQDQHDIKVVLFTLRAEGFEPEEMQLSAGEYFLIVRNRSGLDEFNVRLLRENGENLREARVRGHRRDWKQRLRLTPGTYLFTETNHPDWTCRITVRP